MYIIVTISNIAYTRWYYHLCEAEVVYFIILTMHRK